MARLKIVEAVSTPSQVLGYASESLLTYRRKNTYINAMLKYNLKS